MTTTLDFTKKAQKVTEMSDPISASSQGVGIFFKYYFEKTGVVSIECALLARVFRCRRHNLQSGTNCRRH